MALRQTTGFVESLLRLVDLDRAVPDFSTLSRRQKALVVNIPYRGPKGPLHLLIDRIAIKVKGEGKWHAVSMVVPSGASGARSTCGLMKKRQRFGLWRSPGATSVMCRS